MKPVHVIGFVLLALVGVWVMGQATTPTQQRQNLRLPGSRELPASIKILVPSDQVYVGEKCFIHVEVRDGLGACTGVGIKTLKLKYEDAEIECIDHEPHKTAPGKYEQCIRGLLPGDLKITAIVNDDQTVRVIHLANAFVLGDFRFKVAKDDENGTDKVHQLNVTASLDKNGSYKGFKKCVAHVKKKAQLDMAQYLEGYNPKDKQHHERWMGVVNQLSWNATSPQDANAARRLEGSILGLIAPNGKNSIVLYNIYLIHGEKELDRLILTVVPQTTLDNFKQWFNTEGSEENLKWVAKLPRPPKALIFNDGSPAIPKTFQKNWPFPPFQLKNLYHPGAHFDVRSKLVLEKYGAQATYLKKGQIILKGIAAGTADKVHPLLFLTKPSHVTVDVIPFVWAAQLDGNPVQKHPKDDWKNLSSPFYLKESFCTII